MNALPAAAVCQRQHLLPVDVGTIEAGVREPSGPPMPAHRLAHPCSLQLPHRASNTHPLLQCANPITSGALAGGCQATSVQYDKYVQPNGTLEQVVTQISSAGEHCAGFADLAAWDPGTAAHVVSTRGCSCSAWCVAALGSCLAIAAPMQACQAGQVQCNGR